MRPCQIKARPKAMFRSGSNFQGSVVRGTAQGICAARSRWEVRVPASKSSHVLQGRRMTVPVSRNRQLLQVVVRQKLRDCTDLFAGSGPRAGGNREGISKRI